MPVGKVSELALALAPAPISGTTGEIHFMRTVCSIGCLVLLGSVCQSQPAPTPEETWFGPATEVLAIADEYDASLGGGLYLTEAQPRLGIVSRMIFAIPELQAVVATKTLLFDPPVIWSELSSGDGEWWMFFESSYPTMPSFESIGDFTSGIAPGTVVRVRIVTSGGLNWSGDFRPENNKTPALNREVVASLLSADLLTDLARAIGPTMADTILQLEPALSRPPPPRIDLFSTPEHYADDFMTFLKTVLEEAGVTPHDSGSDPILTIRRVGQRQAGVVETLDSEIVDMLTRRFPSLDPTQPLSDVRLDDLAARRGLR